MEKKKVLAISGSLKASSTNLNLIKAIEALMADRFEIKIYQHLSGLPHFNPDLDTDYPPVEVIEFRTSLREADGILISTPEYAMGVPGSLKNAIDWTVSSMEFSKKPTVLITASSMGEKGHQSLLETLRIIEAGITSETQLLISHAQTKISKDCIKDTKTLCEINALLQAFDHMMEIN